MLGSILGSIASGLIGQGIASKDATLQFERQKNLLGLENAYNTEMWYKNAKYNNPASLASRLMSAGMSPGGALQAVSGNPGVTSPMSSAGAPNVAGMNPGLKNIFGDLGMQIAQIENLKADTRQKNSDTDKTNTMLQYDIKLAEANLNSIAKELSLKDEEINQLQILNKYADKKSEEEINQIVANYTYVQQQTNNLKQEEKKLIWENFFKDNFGIDPHDDISKQLVQASLKGDIAPIMNAFQKLLNSVFSKLKELKPLYDENIAKPIKESFIPKAKDFTLHTKNKIKYQPLSGRFSKSLLGKSINLWKFKNLANLYYGR